MIGNVFYMRYVCETVKAALLHMVNNKYGCFVNITNMYSNFVQGIYFRLAKLEKWLLI